MVAIGRSTGTEMRWLKKHRLGFAMTLLTVIAVIGMFAFSGEKIISPLQGTLVEPILLAMGWTNTIAFNLCVGFLISVFFWWLVVYLPERQRRELLRTSLARRYADFRHNTIQICSWAAKLGLTTQEIEDLMDKTKFREYFKDDDRWYDVVNGLQDEKAYITCMHVEMELFAQELTYTLNNVVVQDDKVHSLFKNLAEQIYRMKYDPNYTSDPAKYISQFLWAMHANWSVIEGYMPNDPIELRIKQF